MSQNLKDFIEIMGVIITWSILAGIIRVILFSHKPKCYVCKKKIEPSDEFWEKSGKGTGNIESRANIVRHGFCSLTG